MEVSFSTWSTDEGQYVTGMIRDLSARKQLEETTRQQELQLIQANKMTALGTLVSGVAHEINNPNQMVLMNANVLETHGATRSRSWMLAGKSTASSPWPVWATRRCARPSPRCSMRSGRAPDASSASSAT